MVYFLLIYLKDVPTVNCGVVCWTVLISSTSIIFQGLIQTKLHHNLPKAVWANLHSQQYTCVLVDPIQEDNLPFLFFNSSANVSASISQILPYINTLSNPSKMQQRKHHQHVTQAQEAQASNSQDTWSLRGASTIKPLRIRQEIETKRQEERQ